jgi:hypothetical protein
MHAFSEEAMEVSNVCVAEYGCHHADLCWREDAQKPLREREADVDLELEGHLVVLGDEGALQRSHLCSDLASNRARTDLYIAVIDQNEMMQQAGWIVEQYPVKIISWRCSQRAELFDHFSLDGSQPFNGATSHERSLKAKLRLSCSNEGTLTHSPVPAKRSALRQLAARTLCRIHHRVAYQVAGRFTRSRNLHETPGCISEGRGLKIRPECRLNRQQIIVVNRFATAAGNKWNSHGHSSFFSPDGERPDIQSHYRQKRQISGTGYLMLEGDYGGTKESTDSNSVANTSGRVRWVPTRRLRGDRSSQHLNERAG